MTILGEEENLVKTIHPMRHRKMFVYSANRHETFSNSSTFLYCGTSNQKITILIA